MVGTQFGELVAQCDSHVANLCEQQMNAIKIVKKSGLAGIRFDYRNGLVLPEEIGIGISVVFIIRNFD